MKKVLFLGLVLALVAILAAPAVAFADTTEVTGEVVGPTISITAPDDFAFDTFTIGRNPAVDWVTSGDGEVNFDPGSDSLATWTISATSTSDASGDFSQGLMWSDTLGRYMGADLVSNDEQMYVSLDGGSSYAQLPGGVTTPPSSVSGISYFQLSVVQVASMLGSIYEVSG